MTGATPRSVRVRVRLAARRIEEHRDAAIGGILVGRLELERAAESVTQAAPQVMHAAVGQRNIGNRLGTQLNLPCRPEAGVDVDRLEAVRAPGDAHRTVLLHPPILTATVRIGGLSRSTRNPDDQIAPPSSRPEAVTSHRPEGR